MDKEKSTHLRDLKEGLHDVFQKKTLALLLILTAVNNLFIMGPAMIGTPIFIREVLVGCEESIVNSNRIMLVLFKLTSTIATT